MGGPKHRAGLSRRTVLLGALAVPAAAAGAGGLVAGMTGAEGATGAGGAMAEPAAAGLGEPDSTFFATAAVGYHEDVDTASDGDLWSSAWADDGNLYAANGDGKGFAADNPKDIVVNRIAGSPVAGLSGTRLADSDGITPIWSDPANYNRKPTGMVAVDGNGDGRDELYLAVQDLHSGNSPDAFNDAPAASIAMSTDHGKTWKHTASAMFSGHVFTTIFFLDFGQSNKGAAVLGGRNAGYVYAYGLDGNWRQSYSHIVPDPVDLFLARVPVRSIQDRATWQFFTGTDSAGLPAWSADIAKKKAVLHDARRIYPSISKNPKNGPTNLSVLGQGSVVYNAPLKRYLYCSWTEYTFEFYEAPQPWGPWKLFLSKDFGPYPWWGHGSATGPKNGGYATTTPSKYISADGRTLWVQANWFVGIDTGTPNYDFSLRKLTLAPYAPSTPANPPDKANNLARTAPGTVPIDTTSHFGHLEYLNDGDTGRGEDSWNGTPKTTDQWGYTWPRAYHLNRVVYTTGTMFADGGWFGSGLKVQVRQNGSWRDVSGLRSDPAYPYDNTAGPARTYTFAFAPTWGDGVRLIGVPGGTEHFTSVTELAVYYDG